jgi:hypothetical protein
MYFRIPYPTDMMFNDFVSSFRQLFSGVGGDSADSKSCSVWELLETISAVTLIVELPRPVRLPPAHN